MRFRPGRPFRRLGPPLFLGRRLIGARLAPGLLGILTKAHGLFAAGRFGEAAGLFENLANTARSNGMARAPRFFVQAARANWRAGETAHGIDLLHTALDLLAAASAVGILTQVVNLATTELNSLGLAREAGDVRTYAAALPGWDDSPPPAPASVRPLLPTRCPQCGGAVRSDEVDWIDEQTAECAYCGSPLRPEK
jgi:hypothetical protein